MFQLNFDSPSIKGASARHTTDLEIVENFMILHFDS